MKMYERFIPQKTEIEKAFEDFCKQHGTTPCKVSGKSQHNPLPALRQKFAKKVYREMVVTYEEIGEVLNRSHVTITNYMNGHAKIRQCDL